MSSSLRPSRYTASSAPASAAVAPSSPSRTSSDRSALAYLLRYETLVRSQDVEDAATSDHLRPLFDRLCVLGGGSSSTNGNADGKLLAKGASAAEDAIPGLIPSHSASTDEGDMSAENADEQTLTYETMKAALITLDADHSKISSADAKYSNGGGDGTAEVLTTDRQLMLLLRTIVDANASLIADGGTDNTGSAGLTYAEFLQVYKVVVGGMQTLQRIPKKADDTNATTKSKNDIRLKIRERTLELIKLFGPSKSNSNDHADDASCSSSVSSLPSLPGKLNRHLHKGGKKARKGMMATRSSSSNSSTGPNSSKYRDPTDLPRDSTFSTMSVASVASTLTDAEDVRKVLTIKDKTMLNLLSDHAGEMDDLTEKMVDMSRKNKRRKTRMIIWGVAMGVLGLSIGIFVGGGASGSHGGRSSSAPSASSTSSPSASASSSPSSSSAHQPDLILANELKYTKRELGQVNAKVTKLQKRLVDAESDAKTATAQLYDCRSDLAAAGREVDDLKVETALARDEIEACQAARIKENKAARAAANVAGTKTTTEPPPSAAVVPAMKQASSAMAGASGAVLFPHIAKAVASGSLRVLAAAGGGLWTGVGLLVGAIISGAMPSILNRKKD